MHIFSCIVFGMYIFNLGINICMDIKPYNKLLLSDQPTVGFYPLNILMLSTEDGKALDSTVVGLTTEGATAHNTCPITSCAVPNYPSSLPMKSPGPTTMSPSVVAMNVRTSQATLTSVDDRPICIFCLFVVFFSL